MFFRDSQFFDRGGRLNPWIQSDSLECLDIGFGIGIFLRRIRLQNHALRQI